MSRDLFSVQLSPLWYSIRKSLATKFSLGSSCISSTERGKLLSSTWVLTPCTVDWKFSQGNQQAGAIIDLTSFASLLSRITVFHCLILLSWKLLFYIFCLFVCLLGYLRWEITIRVIPFWPEVAGKVWKWKNSVLLAEKRFKSYRFCAVGSRAEILFRN